MQYDELISISAVNIVLHNTLKINLVNCLFLRTGSSSVQDNISLINPGTFFPFHTPDNYNISTCTERVQKQGYLDCTWIS